MFTAHCLKIGRINRMALSQAIYMFFRSKKQLFFSGKSSYTSYHTRSSQPFNIVLLTVNLMFLNRLSSFCEGLPNLSSWWLYRFSSYYLSTPWQVSLELFMSNIYVCKFLRYIICINNEAHLIKKLELNTMLDYFNYFLSYKIINLFSILWKEIFLYISLVTVYMLKISSP